MGKKFDEQMICNCSLSRKWWWGSIKVFDSPTKFLVYLDKEGSIDFDQANVKKVTVAYLCNRIDDGGGEFEGTDSHWAVCEPTANGAFAVWEINLSNLYSDPPSPEMVCPKANECIGSLCGHNIPHKTKINCKDELVVCPPCISVPSPEPPEKVREMSHEITEIIKPAYKANGEKYADVAINASCLLLADSILSLLDSPDSPYILKSEVVKRIREIENPYSKDIGEKAMEIRSWFAYNEALQKAVELFEEVRK